MLLWLPPRRLWPATRQALRKKSLTMFIIPSNLAAPCTAQIGTIIIEPSIYNCIEVQPRSIPRRLNSTDLNILMIASQSTRACTAQTGTVHFRTTLRRCHRIRRIARLSEFLVSLKSCRAEPYAGDRSRPYLNRLYVRAGAGAGTGAVGSRAPSWQGNLAARRRGW
jgi:hypothetical protein